MRADSVSCLRECRLARRSAALLAPCRLRFRYGTAGLFPAGGWTTVGAGSAVSSSAAAGVEVVSEMIAVGSYEATELAAEMFLDFADVDLAP